MKGTAILLFALLLGSAGQLQALEIHSQLCLGGCPAGSPESNDLLIREIYILSTNDRTKFADWAAYRVTPYTIGPSESRVWRTDPWLGDGEQLEPEDYKEASDTLKMDRGHLVPLTSFTGTKYWKDTNYMSNIVPQNSTLNRGEWRELESIERQLAGRHDVNSVYVMTGPLYTDSTPRLPAADEPHQIPSGFWKIISVIHNNSLRVGAFLYAQQDTRKPCKSMTEIGRIERATGLRFFHEYTAEFKDSILRAGNTLAPIMGCP